MKCLQFNWLIHSTVNKSIKKAIKSYAKGKMLDIGCGIKPYRKVAEHFVTEHIGLDHIETLHSKENIDIFAFASNIPFGNGVYDTVLATSLLEHVEEPKSVISEISRVLKSKGHCILTTPFMWHLHEEPRDFYRFTKYGLKYLFEMNSFEILELESLSGFWVTFGQEFIYYIKRLRLGGKLNPLWWLIQLIGMCIQGIGWVMNKIDRSERFTAAYLVVARKI